MAYALDERNWLGMDNFALRSGRNGDVVVGIDEEFGIDVDVDVDVEEGPVDDVMDADVGRDRAEERLPLEHSAMVGFFKSMMGLREDAAEQKASWLLSASCYLKAGLWKRRL